jgi:23S rRNA (guanosine2251-2'-O)-methyltransferase
VRRKTQDDQAGWSIDMGPRNFTPRGRPTPGRGAPQPHRRRPLPRSKEASPDEPVILYGWHTVAAALQNPARHVRRLFATENAARRLTQDGMLSEVAPEIVRPDAIAARLSADAVHQGLLAEADPLPSPALEDLEPAGIALVLDQITDPHNVGAILRTAAAFGVAAIITTARHSPQVVTVANLARALQSLRDRGYLAVGLDSTGESELAATALRAPLALVLGAEGKGLRQLTRATCDIVARLDLPGVIKSLNVSNAAALALYVASKEVGSVHHR